MPGAFAPGARTAIVLAIPAAKQANAENAITERRRDKRVQFIRFAW
jgi:hypothetical protein